MIALTRLNSSSLVVNSDLIQYVESAPDTTLTLINGEKVVVRERADEVIDLTIAFRARLMGEAARKYPGGIALASEPALRAMSAQAGIASSEDFDPNAHAVARRRRIES